MTLTASDLKFYSSNVMPEVDGIAYGGAISRSGVVVFDDSTLANTLNVAVRASGTQTSDTQNLTITGRNSAGTIISETLTLLGTTPVNGASTFERLLKISCSANHHGDIVVRPVNVATVVATLLGSGNAVDNIAETEIRRPFYNVSADAEGGSDRVYYEKIFLRNNNAVNALLAATIVEYADPSSRLTFALASGLNDNNTGVNRLTAPPFIGPSGFSAGPYTLGQQLTDGQTDLGPGSGIGVYLALDLPAGTAAAKSTYTLRITGQTT